MTTYISQLDVSLNKYQEQNLRERGFKQIPKDLNKGAGGNKIYLWYKKGPTPITRLQVSFSAGMATGLYRAGFTKIYKNLNAGARGDHIYLWHYQGSGEYDTPIVKIDVTTDKKNEAAKFEYGWERLACNLKSRAGGAWIHFWVKREKQTYICDITATDCYGSDTNLLGSGYMRVDENTNRGTGGSFVFIWYRQTTDPKRALTGLQVSFSDEEVHAFLEQGYTCVWVNLNNETTGNPVRLWFAKGVAHDPIKAIALLVNTALVDDYGRAGFIVIDKDLNAGNQGSTVYLCTSTGFMWYQ